MTEKLPFQKRNVENVYETEESFSKKDHYISVYRKTFLLFSKTRFLEFWGTVRLLFVTYID